MEKLIAFYKNLLTMIGMSITTKGGVFMKSKEQGNLPVTINKKPLVLPTKENIETSIAPTDNGEVEQVKVLFNPMDESAIHGENTSLLKYIYFMERKIMLTFGILGDLIIKIMNNPDNEITDINFTKFIVLLNNYKQPNVKRMIDDSTVKQWNQLFNKIIQTTNSQEGLIHLYIKRGGIIEGERVNRTTVISFPVFEQLLTYKHKNRGDMFMGVELSNKNAYVVRSLYQFIFSESQEKLTNGIMFGSKNNIAPGTHSLLMAYEHLRKKIAEIISGIESMEITTDIVDEDGNANVVTDYLSKALLKPLEIEEEDLDKFITSMENNLRKIPTEVDIVSAAERGDTVLPEREPVKKVTITKKETLNGDDDVYSAIMSNAAKSRGMMQSRNYMPPGYAYQQPAPINQSIPVYPEGPVQQGSNPKPVGVIKVKLNNDRPPWR